jgi:prefoldin subunit 5
MQRKFKQRCLYYFFLRPDTSRIYVNIGFGFYVEFTHDEALKFIKKKTDSLNEKAESFTKDAVTVKAHIKLVLEVSV